LLAVCNGLQKRDGASELEGVHFGGVADRDRVARLEENMELVRALWTGEPVTFHGRFAHYDDIVIRPVPVQRPCPIWISANPAGPSTDRVLTRVATMADGFLTVRFRPGYIAEMVSQLAPKLVAAGRDPSTFPIGAYHSINVGPDPAKCIEESVRFFDHYYGPGMFDEQSAPSVTAVGPPEACIEQLRSVLAEGATHLTLRVSSWDQRRQLDVVIDEVLPGLVT
jgi:alkanesulfonate monooxygenase SsuD/methylene tetrahydromethanopterin reductase-like flavin-dependent oxidoreductase (luciferase family)